MEGISFTVWGEPQGKARPVVTKTGHAFTPKRTVTYEAQVIAEYRAAYPNRVRWEKGVPLEDEDSGEKKYSFTYDELQDLINRIAVDVGGNSAYGEYIVSDYISL